jgi:hypothetical protein
MLRKYFVSNIAFMNSTRSEGGQTIALNTIEKLYGSINALLGDTKTYFSFLFIIIIKIARHTTNSLSHSRFCVNLNYEGVA